MVVTVYVQQIHVNKFVHSAEVSKEMGGLVLSTARGASLIKYEIALPTQNSVVQVQQLDWDTPNAETDEHEPVLVWVNKWTCDV